MRRRWGGEWAMWSGWGPLLAPPRLPTRTGSPFPILLAHSASNGKLPPLLQPGLLALPQLGIKTVPREC